jgi:hypothetical protein
MFVCTLMICVYRLNVFITGAASHSDCQGSAERTAEDSALFEQGSVVLTVGPGQGTPHGRAKWYCLAALLAVLVVVVAAVAVCVPLLLTNPGVQTQSGEYLSYYKLLCLSISIIIVLVPPQYYVSSHSH